MEYSPFIPIGDRGLSQEAREVRRIKYAESSTNSSLGLDKRKYINDLINAVVTGFADNWDGYQAHAADPGSFMYSILFLNQLPFDFPLPQLAVDGDGEIAIEWDYGSRRIISIRVSRDGSLNYAGLVGYSSFHGLEIMRESIPKTILSQIERVIKIPVND
ncbi:MAG: hypothetical protein IMZ62_17600, partial [Chloroflexi bacterium]|nr:hypothetical protein [Chloroflexota bacterium]